MVNIHKLLDHAKKSSTDLQLLQKKAIGITAKAPSDLIGNNKIVDKISRTKRT